MSVRARLAGELLQSEWLPCGRINIPFDTGTYFDFPCLMNKLTYTYRNVCDSLTHVHRYLAVQTAYIVI